MGRITVNKSTKATVSAGHRFFGVRHSRILFLVPLILLLIAGLRMLITSPNNSSDNYTGFMKSRSTVRQQAMNYPSDKLARKRTENSLKDENKKCNVEDYIFGQRVDQRDPCLVKALREKLLIAPPPTGEINRDALPPTEEMPSNTEKFKWIEKLFIENSSNGQGFFVECGANDGEFISPTIRLERKYNWTGLLIEANPIPFQSLLEKRRNAWAINVAACITEHPERLTFYTNPESTGLSGLNERPSRGVNVNVTVQCIPLYTILAAVNVTVVDYLSLDVEGLELAILKTLPFDKITFGAMTVEYVSIPGKQQALKEFLEPKGYRFVKDITDYLTEDSLFVHESLYPLALTILPSLY